MQVEDVAGVGLAAGRTAQQQGHLAVGPGVLGEVVVDAQGVLHELAVDLDADLHDVLAHGRTGVGRQVLQRCRVLGAGHHDDGVLHGPELLQHGHRLGHRGELLADGHVDADEALALLVDDGVHRHGGLARLAVADDELALAAPDGDEGVDGLDAGLHGRVHRLAADDAGRHAFHGASRGGRDGPLVIDGPPQGVHDAADEPRTDRHLDDGAGGLDGVTLLDLGVVAQDDRADRLLLEVERHALDATGELQQLGGQGTLETVDAGDAVTDLHDGADGACLQPCVELVDGGLDDLGDVVGA